MFVLRCPEALPAKTQNQAKSEIVARSHIDGVAFPNSY